MQGDPQVIQHLQAQLRNELTATNQYFLHYRILKHWGFDKLAKKEYEESIGRRLMGFERCVGDDLLDRPRHGRIRLLGRWVHFPLKAADLALHGRAAYVDLEESVEAGGLPGLLCGLRVVAHGTAVWQTQATRAFTAGMEGRNYVVK